MDNQDLQTRVKGFNGEFIPLLKKYKLVLGSEAFLTRDGRVASKPSLFDAPEPQKGQDVANPTESHPKGDEDVKDTPAGGEITEG